MYMHLQSAYEYADAPTPCSQHQQEGREVKTVPTGEPKLLELVMPCEG